LIPPDINKKKKKNVDPVPSAIDPIPVPSKDSIDLV
jgi:hypothetical protein